MERLAEIAEPRSSGLTWHTPIQRLPADNRHAFPQGVDNLGVAHGAPGVIALLARVCTSGVAEERARTLLTGAVTMVAGAKAARG